MRQTSAADAVGKLVADLFQQTDPAGQIVAPAFRDALPFLAVQRLSGQCWGQGRADFGKRKTGALAGLDDGQNAQAGPRIAPVICGIAGGPDQPFAFIKVNGRDGYTASARQRTDRHDWGRCCIGFEITGHFQLVLNFG